MATNTSIWRIQDNTLEPLPRRKLDQEKRLEEWVANDPGIIGLDLCMIGRQVKTAFGGFIDLLGMDQEGDLAIIELKRDRTPREVLAQLLDYASWVDGLGVEDIEPLVAKHSGKSLAQAFLDHFEEPLPDTINQAHKLVVVAAQLDDSTERVAQYLADRHGLDINVAFFNVFDLDGQEVLARSWLMDPETVEIMSTSRKQTRWGGIWFVNLGEQYKRDWEDRRKYGFVSAGGGHRHGRAMGKLKTGDRIFAFITGHGYVGYGEVTQERVLASEFVPEGKKLPLSDLPLTDPVPDFPEGKEEYAVGVRWLETVPKSDAKWINGAFANQNVVCKLRDPTTLEFLSGQFQAAADGAS